MKSIKEKISSYPDIMSMLMFVFGGFLVVFLTNNFFAVFAPFIIAYIITRLLRPMMVWIKNKTKIPNVLNTILCMIIFAGISGLVIWLIGHYLVEGIAYLIKLLSSNDTVDKVIALAQEISLEFESVTKFLRIDANASDIAIEVGDLATKVISLLSKLSINLASKIPTIILSFIIGCVAAFYMLADYDKIASEITNRLSPKTKRVVDVFNNQALSSFIKMVLSYILISIICFIELMVGFFIIGIDRAVFIALIVAILDVLPVLGSGIVLIPWGIVSIVMGNPVAGIGLLVLYIIVTIVRQIIEPKIVGAQIGLYPLVTLASLYVGLRLMGGIGLILGPLYVIVWKELNEEGIFRFGAKKETAVNQKIDTNEQDAS